MEQPPDDRTAGCSNMKRPKLPEVVNVTEEVIDASASVRSLETINDNCLRKICGHLDIVDIVNLATISGRLLRFAKAVYFPEIAPRVSVVAYIFGKYQVTLPLYRSDPVTFTSEAVIIAFRCFGESVTELTLKRVQMFSLLLRHCPNLRTLNISNIKLELRVLQDRIESLAYLDELKFNKCNIDMNPWSASKAISNVRKLSIRSLPVHNYFIRYFKNLTSLTIVPDSSMRIIDLERIFDNNRHSLKHFSYENMMHRFDGAPRLIAEKFENRMAPDAVAQLIADRLQELENLEFVFHLNDATRCFIALPHLRTVDIICNDGRCIFSALRTLSENGTIERLRIHGTFCHETEPPLRFRQLRKLELNGPYRLAGILQTFTKSQMPAIQTFQCGYIKTPDLGDLGRFIESKRTLRTFEFRYDDDVIPVAFWRRVIDVLKQPTEPRRPLLCINIGWFVLDDEAVSKLCI